MGSLAVPPFSADKNRERTGDVTGFSMVRQEEYPSAKWLGIFLFRLVFTGWYTVNIYWLSY